MDEHPCPQDTSFRELGLEPGEAHRLFLLAIGGDPKQFNLSDLALRTGVNVSRLWSWSNGKSRWPADAWLTTMRALGSISETKDGTLKIKTGGKPPLLAPSA